MVAASPIRQQAGFAADATTHKVSMPATPCPNEQTARHDKADPGVGFCEGYLRPRYLSGVS
jgi:hypothetical protein